MFLLSPQRFRGKQAKKSSFAQTKNNGNSCYVWKSYNNVRYISICKTGTFCIITASQCSFFVAVVCLRQCVFEVSKEDGLILTELWPGVSIQDVQISTGCPFQVSFSLFRK